MTFLHGLVLGVLLVLWVQGLVHVVRQARLRRRRRQLLTKMREAAARVESAGHAIREVGQRLTEGVTPMVIEQPQIGPISSRTHWCAPEPRRLQ